MSNEKNEINTILSDDELGDVSGGAGFDKCPLGHWESTGFALGSGPSSDCEIGKCTNFKRKLIKHGHTDGQFPKPTFIYEEYCGYFERTVERTYLYVMPTNA